METSDDQVLQERANDLYWNSDDSVNQIADDMELSKGALYGLVEPLPAGLSCPRCGTEMEYPNRTARDKGHLSCPSCELEEDEDVVRDAGSGEGEGPVPTLLGTGPDARDALNRMLLGSALLGAAVGAALTLWARRK